ncbi:MAG: acyl-ACP--UDP-N-acetylglucosamine O-acyltransferase [Calditrichia bacterium]
MATIHPTAIVSAKAELGENVSVGPYAIIEDDVIIGNNCVINARAYIANGARLAKNVLVGIGAVLSNPPQDLKYKDEKTTLEVGENTVIREYATLNRGTDYNWKTIVGRDCFLMSYVHVAHDCIIGNNVIISNAVNMAGHVEIDDYVGIGGMSAVHQFVRIGRHSFVGGGLRVNKDVPPYILAQGDPIQYGGINSVGMSRKGFADEDIADVKRAYRVLYKSDLIRKEALDKIRGDFKMTKSIESIVNFVENSTRGIIRG